MDLISDELHATLTYIAAVGRANAPLDRDALIAFAQQPSPAEQLTARFGLSEAFERYARAYERQVRAAEGPVDYLERVGWITGASGSIRLTPLGAAVLAHADRPPLADISDEPLSVTIDPMDPLAYTRVFELLSSHGNGLLVDRYLRLDGLADLMSVPTVTESSQGTTTPATG